MRFQPLSLAVVLGLSFPVCSEAQDHLDLGKQMFQSCVACHGPDGKGIKAGDLLMAPSLYDSPYVKEDHPEILTAILLKGIQKEDNTYIQAMLALEAALDDEQIAGLVSYVTKEYGGKERKTTPEQVKKWREAYSSQTAPWSRADLEEMRKSAEAPKLLSNARYSIYSGKWKALPDFSSMEPDQTGTFADDIFSLEPATALAPGFGIVFEADLKIPITGDYHFSLTSDDGSALIIDGETVVGNDGIHGAKTVRMKEQLQAGIHTMRIPYFDGGGERFFALSIRGGGEFGTVHLSKEKAVKKAKAQDFAPIMLTPQNPGEAIVHRSFLPDAMPRAIGVGYPGAVNLVWDADALNLAYVYRGEFMDAASHWNGRGSGSTPAGVDRVKTGATLPFQILESLDEPWESLPTERIKYEKDTAKPSKEITIFVKHPDYQFRGYRLDEKRFPTFRYDYRDLEITDRFDPKEVDGVSSIERTVSIKGTPEENSFFRVASTGPQTITDDWIDIGSGMAIKLTGADPVTREIGDQKETLAAIQGEDPITITYRWNAPLQK